MSDPNGINTGVDIPDPSPIRATSSTRIGCNNLLKDKDTGAIQSISFEFRKLEELYNRSPSGSSESQPNFEAQYADIPEASDLLDDASASAIAQQEVSKLEGSQSGVSFSQAVNSWAKIEGGIKSRFSTSPEGLSFSSMEDSVIGHRGKY
jgi:hypothetical protein